MSDPIDLTDTPDALPQDQPLGRVAAPAGQESTSEKFFFWVDRDRAVERTQIVRTHCDLAGRPVEFVGVVQEVYRRSRQRSIGEESGRFDGRSAQRPPFDSEGVTYAEVSILRTDPVTYAPPTEESTVYLATEAEAGRGYGTDRMGWPFSVGLLRNGGAAFAGPAVIDLDFLLGKNGGHLNVNGIAGLGTKSSLLLTVNMLLLRESALQLANTPGRPDRLQVVPVVFNVKNYDLFFIDHWSAEFRRHEGEYRADWLRLGVEPPRPFQDVCFFAPQMKGLATPVNVGRADTAVRPYSWSLADVIEGRLFRFLFADEDVYDPNFGGLASDVEEWLTTERNDGPRLRATDGAPQTFRALVDWFRDHGRERFGDFASATRGKFLRHLKWVVQEGDGVLRRDDARGTPLAVPAAGTKGPMVIDLFGILRTPSLQRFVVAAVFHQIVRMRSENPVSGLRYLITLDELNRFAPRGGTDPITRQIETVAAEMRSQGVILLGAQQQASLVSAKVIENCSIRAAGRSGTLETNQEVWKGFGRSARAAAAQLQPDEKLIHQPSFREPMLAKIPFPPFALNREDAVPEPAAPDARRSRAEAAHP